MCHSVPGKLQPAVLEAGPQALPGALAGKAPRTGGRLGGAVWGRWDCRRRKIKDWASRCRTLKVSAIKSNQLCRQWFKAPQREFCSVPGPQGWAGTPAGSRGEASGLASGSIAFKQDACGEESGFLLLPVLVLGWVSVTKDSLTRERLTHVCNTRFHDPGALIRRGRPKGST